LEENLMRPFRQIPSVPTTSWFENGGIATRPATDFFHFTGGKNKPWVVGPPDDFSDEGKRWSTPSNFWFYNLNQLNEELDMGLHFHNWTIGKRKERRQQLGTSSMFYTIQNSSTNLLEETYE